MANADGLTSKDKEGHTFKVGSTTEDFGGDFKDGSIDQVLFWKRSLSKKEISTAAKKKIDELNTPDFHWKKPGKSAGKQLNLVKTGTHPGYGTIVSLEKNQGITIHEAWMQPLETSDHREIVRAWDKNSLQARPRNLQPTLHHLSRHRPKGRIHSHRPQIPRRKI